MREIRRLGALAQPPRGPMAVSILAASLAVGFGVALMTSAGYLISRAAEQPPILSLTIVIVAVRFFGLARPLARYCERLVSHDAALRALATIRSRFYERIGPGAAQLREYRSGELLARMVGTSTPSEPVRPRARPTDRCAPGRSRERRSGRRNPPGRRCDPGSWPPARRPRRAPGRQRTEPRGVTTSGRGARSAHS
jgi:hypothetical protein